LETGAGYDQIDVHACTAHDIKVSNVPTAVDDATADTNMFLILGALRGFNMCKAPSPNSGLTVNKYKQ
jgi:lactate dehydrogenase-like 2-hydroxyacid dehydrogenase